MDWAIYLNMTLSTKAFLGLNFMGRKQKDLYWSLFFFPQPRNQNLGWDLSKSLDNVS